MKSTTAGLTAETTPGLTAETMADAMADGDGDHRAAGSMPGWVWALPGGPGCAGHARRVLGDALASLGVPRDAIADAQLMVSELATNAHQHAGEHGPHELWLYLGENETGEDAADEPDGDGDDSSAGAGAAGGDAVSGEVRCAVFDAFPDAALPGYSWTSGDCGRGLSIVRELSGGRWGMRRTRSRLGPSVRGKAVWFAVPGATAGPGLG
ncbi:ATP-binding protein [Actinomadura sp. KC06]|uniref:ATP-binding protein n=1 Tax=Actinomadura sp. KC06 TaxID=2530369 RepID=UPI00104CEE55|nr:ATP-binding protein [Actinomadura sp. KC06]TDD24851.1 ATP-binding protein [Actinomadura sp. KC06]